MSKKMQIEFKDNLNESITSQTFDNSVMNFQDEIYQVDMSFKRQRSSQKMLPSDSSNQQLKEKTFSLLYKFQISVTMLSLLRAPEIKDHSEFDQKYLNKLYASFKSLNLESQAQAYGIYIHLMMSEVQNIEQMECLGEYRQQISKINEQRNHTNIMNAYCILENLKRVNQIIQQLQLLANLFVELVSEQNNYIFSKNTMIISKNIVQAAVSSNGYLDVYFCPYLINKFKFSGVYRCFSLCKQIQITQRNYAKTFIQIIQQSKQSQIDYKQWYKKQVKKIIKGQYDLSDLKNKINLRIQNQYIEKLLIGLQGWGNQRQQVIKLLNVYYDNCDWQLRSPFNPSISQCGQSFTINYLIEDTKDHRQNIMICVKAPSFNSYYQKQCFSWHRPKLNSYVSDDLNYLWIHQEICNFPKSGFYDWKLFMFRKHGKNQGVNKIFNISQNRKLQSTIFKKKIHSIKRVQGRYIVHPSQSRQLQMHQIYMDALCDQEQRVPNFQDAAKQIEKSTKYGVNCVYLMGIFQRDTGQFGDKVKGYKRPQASPLALTCRKSLCNMFGGKQNFIYLMNQANKIGVKIITDCTLRVSSSRMDKKYRHLILNSLDDKGKKLPVYGSDGRSIQYEDTILLNYRKKQSWDLLLSEIIEIVQKYKINGIYLDNGFSWPKLYEINKEELYRKDSDQSNAYTYDQIFQGQIVIKQKSNGFWHSKTKYSNPFLIQLCKRLWSKYPNFLIVCQGFQTSNSDDKTPIIINSGPIPRIFKMPQAISQILGYHLHQSGSISQTSQKNIIALKKWYQGIKKLLPRNSIIISSTTSHAWPYPAYIFKQATWAFVDLFFFLPEIPITFIGEHEGRAYRTKTTSIFIEIDKNSNSEKISDKSMRKIHSSFFNDVGEKHHKDNLIKGTNPTIRDPNQIKNLQANFRKEVGPQFGFDLAQIKKHYQHRSRLRKQIPLLTTGHMISVSAQHMYGIHNNVLSFAKWNSKQIILIAINFNPAPIDMHFNLTNFKYLFSHANKSSIVVKIVDLFNEKSQEDYYLVNQLINSKIQTHIQKYQSLLWRITICQKDQIQKAYQCSTKRIVNKLSQNPPKWIYSSILTNQLVNLVSKTNKKQHFVNGLICLYQKFIKPYNIDFNFLISKTHQFWVNKDKLSKLFAIFKLIENYPDLGQILNNSIHNILMGNKLGPIAFVTPQVGAWSSVGGLGVMVDQLSQQLAKLGQEVYLITPYYQYNKKKQTNYLIKDGFNYQRNLKVYSAHLSYQFGIHRGKHKGVNYVWLHNPQLFSKPYDGEDALYVSKQLVFFALSVLQSFCQLKIFPSIIVTNDWMCGFVSAYVKNRKFSTVFDGTKFMHICHNLDPLYQGRLYPKFQQGNLDWLIQLPPDWYVQYRNNKLIINPSKCALQTCDNWGTVSNSYKFDLLKDSPLSHVLWKHPNPFSFPNGIRKQQRLHYIQSKTPGNHNDSKKLLQQKYFHFTQLNDQMPLFSFIGRVTKQKGVHLIVDAIQPLLNQSNYKVQFLLCGPSDSKQEYGKYCASRMKYLTSKYPHCVWSDPDAFFTDGPLVNIGSDYAMMPSQFQPGGIVQHEFFAGSTPVVAFRTGGLKDTVFQYDYKTHKGNGFNFMSYELEDFKRCMRRAIQCYKNKKHYKKLRQNAFESVIEQQDVAKGWNHQFYRLQNKMYVQWDRVQRQIKLLQNYKQDQNDQQPKVLEGYCGQFWKEDWQIKKDFKQVLIGAARLKGSVHTFTFESTKIPRPKDVYIIGSWDDWNSNTQLHFNQLPKNWTVSLKLTPGVYYYKYKVDNQWTLTKNQDIDTDLNNNDNHIVVID